MFNFLIFLIMSMQELNNQTMWNLLSSYYTQMKHKNLAGIMLAKSYCELTWDERDVWKAFASAFHIKPKAGATKARTLYERMQNYIK